MRTRLKPTEYCWPRSHLLGGVLVLDPAQSRGEAEVVRLILEYRLWLVDPQGGDSAREWRRRAAGARN